MEGPRLLAEAQRRVAAWLENEPGVQLRSDVSGLAATAVNLVVEVLNGRHVLVLKETGWRLEHDLRCRLGNGKRLPLRGAVEDLAERTEGATATTGALRAGTGREAARAGEANNTHAGSSDLSA